MTVFLPIQALFRPRRTIGSFRATVTIEEVAVDSLEITSHPVQQGASITDHAFVLPAKLSIKTVSAPFLTPLSEIYSRVLALQSSRIPLDVITGKRRYSDMLIIAIAQTTNSETENILALSIDLQQIITTQIEVVSVAPRTRQRMPEITDDTAPVAKVDAAPEPTGTGPNQSVLQQLLGSP